MTYMYVLRTSKHVLRVFSSPVCGRFRILLSRPWIPMVRVDSVLFHTEYRAITALQIPHHILVRTTRVKIYRIPLYRVLPDIFTPRVPVATQTPGRKTKVVH